jgi:tRNA (guanine26-N2/guanine27-N2)-dimethyltransferase
VGTVVANDLDAAAVESIRRNVAFAGEAAAKVVIPMETDARVLMLQLEKSFDVVDLDPYGTPAMFLDSAMQSVKDGGLMLITATDMAVLCGNNKEVRSACVFRQARGV